jgi:RNA polymerase sigma-70 factor (ECF subfamily)
MTAPDEVLRVLYARHAPGIRRYLGRIVGDADAEDLAHDVFERAQGAEAPTSEDQAAAWLYRIARNAALDRLRSRSVRARGDVVDALREDVDPGASRPDLDLARAQMRSCILDLVDRLAPSHRAVVLLSELGGLSDRETALALGVTLGAAKIRLHRARQALRALMDRECHTFRDERNELACEPTGAGPRREV